jgi:protein SCO1/2
MYFRTAIIGLISAIVAVAAATALAPLVRQLIEPGGTIRTVGAAAVGGPFTLTDHTGRTVTDKDFRGRYMLVFFGFTFCPDICPSGLQTMAAALDKVGAKADRITPIFITVDPERDTSEKLKEYVAHFHPRLVGLTGTPEQIQDVARAYRAYYKKVKDERSSAPYTMDHTSIIYLMGPDGAFVTHFTHATPLDTMAAAFERLR